MNGHAIQLEYLPSLVSYMATPRQVAKVVETAFEQGITHTYHLSGGRRLARPNGFGRHYNSVDHVHGG